MYRQRNVRGVSSQALPQARGLDRTTRSRPCCLRREIDPSPTPLNTGPTSLALLCCASARRELLLEVRVAYLLLAAALASGSNLLDVEVRLPHVGQRDERHVRCDVTHHRSNSVG